MRGSHDRTSNDFHVYIKIVIHEDLECQRFFHKLPQSNFVFIVNDKYYYNKPTNLFCSHWFKPKADRSMKCPCPLRWATQKTKETEKDVCTWEIVDIAPPKINPVKGWGNVSSPVEQVFFIHQQALSNWKSLTRKILKNFHNKRLAGLHLNHLKTCKWMTPAKKKKGTKQK